MAKKSLKKLPIDQLDIDDLDALLPEEEGISLRERRFIDAYLGDAMGNGAAAARLAGYKPSNAKQSAQEVLSRLPVQDALRRRLKQSVDSATREEVIHFFTQAMRGKKDRTLPNGDVVIEEVSMKDRMRAAELLAKYTIDEKKQLEVNIKSDNDGLTDLLSAIADRVKPASTKMLKAKSSPVIDTTVVEQGTSQPSTNTPTNSSPQIDSGLDHEEN